jgi:uncharacterized membrane protein
VSQRSIAIAIFGIIGATLIGLGVILVLAHNWESLSRPMRAGISIGTLITSQVIVTLTMLLRGKSVAWREGAGVFNMAMIGASIALIGQTYHIPEDPAGFMLTWMLLAIPVVYLLKATLPSLLYLAGITAWAGYVQSEGGHAVGFWILAALFVPHYVLVLREQPDGVRARLLSSGVAVCLLIATGITLEKTLPGTWLVVYPALCAAMYLVGSHGFGGSMRNWQSPLWAFGAGGAAVVSLMLTFQWPWENIGWQHIRYGRQYHAWAGVLDYVLCLVFLSSAATLLYSVIKRGEHHRILLGVAPLISLVAYLITSMGLTEGIPQAMFNLYVAALGLLTLSQGLRGNSITRLNGGLLLVAALIMARFFDAELDFVLRGVAFIVIGIGFLGANVFLLRRRSLISGDLS